MRERPLVSIIIPTKNRIELFKQSLLSALNQSYENIEVIVIDDSDNDHVEQFIKKLKTEKIIYLHRHNGRKKSVSNARNLGIYLSKGNYIAFLDDDDLWLPNKIEKQVKEMESKDAYFSFTQGYLMYNNKIIGTIGEIKPHSNINKFRLSLFLNNFVPTSSVMIKSSVLKTIGYFDESLMYAEDYDMWIRLVMSLKSLSKIVYVPEPLFIYRIHDLNSKPSTLKFNYRIKVLTKNYKILLNRESNRILRLLAFILAVRNSIYGSILDTKLGKFYISYMGLFLPIINLAKLIEMLFNFYINKYV